MVLLLVASCSSIQMQREFRANKGDWIMYGGVKERTNVALCQLMPSLTKAWEYEAGAGFSSYAGAIIDSTFFFGTLQGELHLINIVTGKGTSVADFGTAIVGAPIVDKGNVYIALAHDEESLIAYNTQTGKNEWKAKLGDIETSPLLVEDKLYVTTFLGSLACVNKKSGMIEWAFQVPHSNSSSMIHSSPASDGRVVVFGSDNGSVYAVSIDSGRLVWQTHTGAAIMASPSISERKVFTGSLDHSFYALDAASGEIAWKRTLSAPIFSSQAVDDRHVYVGTTDHTLYCLNKSDGTIVWTYRANSIFNAAPIVAGDVVIAGCTDRTVYAFQANDGKLLWQFKTEGRVKTMPLVWNEYLLVLAENQIVLAFKSESVR